MYKDLITPEKVPPIVPDINPSKGESLRDVTVPSRPENRYKGDPILPPAPNVSESERLVIEKANALLAGFTASEYKPQMLLSVSTARPALTLLTLGQVKRQRDQVAITSDALKGLKRNLLSAFRAAQIALLEKTINRALDSIIDGEKEPVSLTREEITIVQSTLLLFYQAALEVLGKRIPSPFEAIPITPKIIETAARYEVTGEGAINAYSMLLGTVAESYALSAAHSAFEYVVRESIEYLEDLMGIALREGLRADILFDTVSQVSAYIGYKEKANAFASR